MSMNLLEQFGMEEMKMGLSPVTNLSMYMMMPMMMLGMVMKGMKSGEYTNVYDQKMYMNNLGSSLYKNSGEGSSYYSTEGTKNSSYSDVLKQEKSELMWDKYCMYNTYMYMFMMGMSMLLMYMGMEKEWLGVVIFMFLMTMMVTAGTMFSKEPVNGYKVNMMMSGLSLVLLKVCWEIMSSLGLGMEMNMMLMMVSTGTMVGVQWYWSKGLSTGGLYPSGFGLGNEESKFYSNMSMLLSEWETLMNVFASAVMLNKGEAMSSGLSNMEMMLGVYTGLNMMGVWYFLMAIMNNLEKESMKEHGWEMLGLGVNAIMKVSMIMYLYGMYKGWNGDGENLGMIWSWLWVGSMMMGSKSAKYGMVGGGGVGKGETTESGLSTAANMAGLMSATMQTMEFVEKMGVTSDGVTPSPGDSLSKGHKNAHDFEVEMNKEEGKMESKGKNMEESKDSKGENSKKQG